MNEFESNRDSTLSAEYVLGLMSSEEKAQFEDRLDQELNLRYECDYWAERLVGLTDSLEPIVPPVHIKQRLETRLFTQQASTQESSFFARLFAAKWFGGIAALCVIAMGIWLVVPSSFSPNYSAQLQAQDQSLMVAALYDAKHGQLQVKPEVGKAKPGHDYELWVIVGNKPPVSLGVLALDGTQMIQVPKNLLVALSTAVLAISDEPTGGSPTGLPTGPVVAVSPISVI